MLAFGRGRRRGGGRGRARARGEGEGLLSEGVRVVESLFSLLFLLGGKGGLGG